MHCCCLCFVTPAQHASLSQLALHHWHSMPQRAAAVCFPSTGLSYGIATSHTGMGIELPLSCSTYYDVALAACMQIQCRLRSAYFSVHLLDGLDVH
jgi:hypothetical protein